MRAQESTLADGGTGIDGTRHRILREIALELNRHPIVVEAYRYPPSTFTEVRATLVPTRWAIAVQTALLSVTWYPLDPPEFVFHYSDETFDCGWHHEPNPHVDGLAHYQEKADTDSYTYEKIEFQGRTPTQLVWEVMDRLHSKLEARYGHTNE